MKDLESDIEIILKRTQYTGDHLLWATDKVQFECVAKTEDGSRESTLWRGVLPNGALLFICSLRRPVGQPHYDRGFRDSDEAHSFFHRAAGVIQ